MSTQLRLVEPLEPTGSTELATRRPLATRTSKRARTGASGSRRRVHWAADWRLDATTRQIGRQGVAAARAELARVHGSQPNSKIKTTSRRVAPDAA